MNLIHLHGVVVGYPGRPILPPVDLTLRKGVFLGMVGPNGSGKTTLLRTMIGLLAPLAGRIDRAACRFGYVPQRDAVDPSFPFTAFEVALMGRYGRIRPGSRPRPVDREAARRALADVDAFELADQPYHALSGGQRQRVLIARALAGEPDALMLDEPTTGMDLPSERGMLELVDGLRRRGIAVVMVSHHLPAVADYASELVLVPGDGRPVEIGGRAEMLTAERLSRIYGQPVSVAEVAGHTAIFLGAGRDASSLPALAAPAAPTEGAR